MRERDAPTRRGGMNRAGEGDARARARRGVRTRERSAGVGREGAPSAMAAAQLPVPMRRAHAGQHNTLGQQPTSASRRCARTQSVEIEISKKERLRRGFGVTFRADASAGSHQRRRQGKQNKTPPFRTKKRAKIVLARHPPPAPLGRTLMAALAQAPARSAAPALHPASRVRVARGLASSARRGYSRARRVPRSPPRAHRRIHRRDLRRRPRGPRARPARRDRRARPRRVRGPRLAFAIASRRASDGPTPRPGSTTTPNAADARDRRAAINNDANGAGRRFARPSSPRRVPPRRPPRRLVRHAPDDRAAPERRARRDGTRARARIRRPEGRPRSRARG